ncbi:Ecdysteroid Kinase 25 [Neodiprion lecontei]|uniref:Uncharacterized protein LOC107221148 n=1 Tax=Neodiprion lecontei TaxID=441921 RepID=A0A6J0BLI1_NEOLC|nr:uncharacterized protein LOC107221148 [Neodiprion lecontei]KAJ4016110.1 Ecdysteroid Kinase 25 [Neodiprion lecontei]
MGDAEVKFPEGRIEVELRDLDVLLRKKFGDSLIVDSFTTCNLVPPGENYGSSMLGVEAVVRRDGQSSEPEELSLIAKMTPPTEFQKMIFDSPFTFRKEMNMFKVIGPAYQALERECGIPESEVLDILPNFYGGRLSLNETEDTFDHDAVILMENLKAKNYACLDRMVGVDLPHAKFAIEELARFHAVSIAVKLKKPDVFEELKENAKLRNFEAEMFMEFITYLINIVKDVPVLHPHLPRIEKALSRPVSDIWNMTPEEPWGAIVHTDLWTNNLMFRVDANGKPESVKFVDFQTYMYLNPMRDLVFFVISSCQSEVVSLHMEELADFYYEKFLSHLARLDCDVNLFPRHSFDAQFAAAASLEFFHCMFMARIICADAKNDPSTANPEIVLQVEPTDEFRRRLTEITLKYVNENWI